MNRTSDLQIHMILAAMDIHEETIFYEGFSAGYNGVVIRIHNASPDNFTVFAMYGEYGTSDTCDLYKADITAYKFIKEHVQFVVEWGGVWISS